MMFTNNMVEYSKTGRIGKCPKCGNDLEIDKIETPIRDNYTVICSCCEKSEYFTGAIKQ